MKQDYLTLKKEKIISYDMTDDVEEQIISNFLYFYPDQPITGETYSRWLIKMRGFFHSTQEEIASAAGTAQKTISRYESGTSVPNADIRNRIANFFYNIWRSKVSSWNFKKGEIYFDPALKYRDYKKYRKEVMARFKSEFTPKGRKFFIDHIAAIRCLNPEFYDVIHFVRYLTPEQKLMLERKLGCYQFYYETYIMTPKTEYELWVREHEAVEGYKEAMKLSELLHSNPICNVDKYTDSYGDPSWDDEKRDEKYEKILFEQLESREISAVLFSPYNIFYAMDHKKEFMSFSSYEWYLLAMMIRMRFVCLDHRAVEEWRTYEFEDFDYQYPYGEPGNEWFTDKKPDEALFAILSEYADPGVVRKEVSFMGEIWNDKCYRSFFEGISNWMELRRKDEERTLEDEVERDG